MLLALLGVALAVVVLAYLTTPSMLTGTDFLRIHVFYKAYWAEAFRAGRWLPLWNPHVNLGRPFLADVDSGLFYPPDLLYLLLDVHAASAALVWLHVFLAMVGMTLWLCELGVERRVALVLACLMPLTAPFAEVVQNGLIHYIFGLCFLPWVLLYAQRLQDSPSWSAAAKLAGVVALQYLGGHAQVSWIAGLGACLFVLVRRLERPLGPSALRAARDTLGVGASFAWGFAIAALQVLPTLELASQGNRHASLAMAASFALPPIGLLSLVEPVGPRFPLDLTSNLFCGTALLVAGLAGLGGVRRREVRALVVIVLFSLLLALGTATPFFRLCYAWLPGCAIFRLHSRTMILALLALMASAGLVLSERRPAAHRLVLCVAAAVLLVAVLLQAGLRPALIQAPAAWRLGVVVLTAALLWLWFRPGRLATPKAHLGTGLALAFVLALELALSLHGIKRIRANAAPEAPERALAGLLAANHLVEPRRPPPRVSFPMPYVRENAGMQAGFSTFAGYVTMTLDRVFAFIYGMRGLEEPLLNSFPATNVYGGGPFPFSTMNLQLGFDPERKSLFLNPAPDPRVYLAEQAVMVGDWRTALHRMEAGHDIRHAVLLEQALALPAGPDGAAGAGEAQITDFAAEQIHIETRSARAAWLVLGEAWYPGWTATVDGHAAPCVPGNVWMRVIPVPAGVHQVELVYRSRYLGLGLAVTALGLLGLVAVGLRARRRRVVAS